MATTQTTSFPINPDEIRARIIADLELAHLTKDEQDQIIEALGEVLLERATYEVMSRIPEDALESLDALAESSTDDAMQAAIKKYVPDVEEVVMRAVSEGIEEHKRLVAQEVEKEAAAQAPQQKKSLEDHYFAE